MRGQRKLGITPQNNRAGGAASDLPALSKRSAAGSELQVPARPPLCPPEWFPEQVSMALLPHTAVLRAMMPRKGSGKHYGCSLGLFCQNPLLQFCIQVCKTRHGEDIECPWSSRNGNQIPKKWSKWLKGKHWLLSFFFDFFKVQFYKENFQSVQFKLERQNLFEYFRNTFHTRI